MKKISWFFLLAFSLLGFVPSEAQDAAPFADEIAAFKKADSLQAPPQAAVLFVGSSSFRLWANLQQAFPAKTIINRGFGGSSLVDVIRYADDIILPYHAKQIVIYCGENDIASSDTVSATMVFNRFKQLFSLIRSKQPNVPVVFVSIKPSPSRWAMRDRMLRANALIRVFLAARKNTSYVNVWGPMLKNLKPNEELFVKDKLHMNEKGYAIWKKAIEPKLVKQ